MINGFIIEIHNPTNQEGHIPLLIDFVQVLFCLL